MKTTNKLIIAILMIFPLIGGFIIGQKWGSTTIIHLENPKIEDNIATILNNMHIIFGKYNIYDIDNSDELAELIRTETELANIYNW